MMTDDGALIDRASALRYCAVEPPTTIFSLSFWSTVSTVRSISAFGMPS